MEKIKLNLHCSKVWAYLYPIYAKDFLFGSDYEKFANKISESFDLTSDQWEAVLNEWEFKEKLLTA